MNRSIIYLAAVLTTGCIDVDLPDPGGTTGATTSGGTAAGSTGTPGSTSHDASSGGAEGSSTGGSTGEASSTGSTGGLAGECRVHCFAAQEDYNLPFIVPGQYFQFPEGAFCHIGLGGLTKVDLEGEPGVVISSDTIPRFCPLLHATDAAVVHDIAVCDPLGGPGETQPWVTFVEAFDGALRDACVNAITETFGCNDPYELQSLCDDLLIDTIHNAMMATEVDKFELDGRDLAVMDGECMFDPDLACL